MASFRWLVSLFLGVTVGLHLPAPTARAQGADELPPAPVGQTPFLWGVTLSDYQNDGAHPAMDWAELERSGRLPERSGLSANFRGHMQADLDRAASLGLNAFRTSIEWSRIEPVEGQFDRAEVAHLHRLLDGIRKRKMTPVIALHHFATPRWAMEASADGLAGWENPRIVERYNRYVAFVTREFGKKIDWYITFNEPATLILGGYMMGWTLPHRMGPVSTVRATANLVTAHVEAYKTIHRLDGNARVSLAEYNALFPIADGGIHYMPSQLLNLVLDKHRGWDGRPRVRYLDYLALHYYGAVDAGAATSFPVQPWRWGVRPEHMDRIIRAYHEAFRLPILLAENGFATRNREPRSDGWTREAYLVAHIDALRKLKDEGLPILGYMYWTLTDNYEWGSFDPRFGLWRIDIRNKDLTRHPTPAVEVYREIIRAGGVTPTLRMRYPPPSSPP
ncbi:MAG: family 1 glycosylhydrolase [Candidatus Sericytochromatia bacterium]|nr:family 1 glycosylhydrolase [Candidatus Sericytochromatia bacterium]